MVVKVVAAHDLASRGGDVFTHTIDPRVAERLPTVFNLLNGVLVLALLRIALPRLLAIQSMGDLYEFAPELGLPTRDELLGYVEYTPRNSSAQFRRNSAQFSDRRVFLPAQ